MVKMARRGRAAEQGQIAGAAAARGGERLSRRRHERLDWILFWRVKDRTDISDSVRDGSRRRAGQVGTRHGDDDYERLKAGIRTL